MSVPITRDWALEQFGLNDWNQLEQVTKDYIGVRDIVGKFIEDN